jgi:hypothetical protein
LGVEGSQTARLSPHDLESCPGVKYQSSKGEGVVEEHEDGGSDRKKMKTLSDRKMHLSTRNRDMWIGIRAGAQTIQNEETSRKSRVRMTEDIHPPIRAMWTWMRAGAQTIQNEETRRKSYVHTTVDMAPSRRVMWIVIREGAQTIQNEETSRKSHVRMTVDMNPSDRILFVTLVTEVSLISREPNLRFERISISRGFL